MAKDPKRYEKEHDVVTIYAETELYHKMKEYYRAKGSTISVKLMDFLKEQYDSNKDEIDGLWNTIKNLKNNE